jgi:hypothetical protein
MAYAKPIEAYHPTVGAMRDYIQAHAGEEPGDPSKAAAVILGIADHVAPPLRLPLGNDALAILRSSYRHNLDELERWAPLTQSTDFDAAASSSTDHAVLKIVGQA